MIGMDRRTGKRLSGVEHLAQSIGDILTTPIGSRVARRDYGSHLPELIDQPMNAAGRLRLYAATALALLRWEPRISVSRVELSGSAPGTYALTITGTRTDVAGRPDTTLTIPL